MKFLNAKKLKYLVYMISVIVLILAAFNTYLTIRIHKQLVRVVSNPGEWPPGAYVHDPDIGFDFAPNIAAQKPDASYYVKSHQFGYRIDEHEDAESYRPGGLLSLGCSFTYGDEVESRQTFTQLAANGLRVPAYNYGICSFSYTHALLKARKLKEQGILDKLQPKYVLLGCWSGLPDRSRLPFPPLASRQLPLPAAYITKDGNNVKIQAPRDIQHVFKMVDLYREEGTELSFKKFMKIFTAVPGYLYLYSKNNQLSRKVRNQEFRSGVSDFEIYDFYFTGIENLFLPYRAKILVLHMPNHPHDEPGKALTDALAKHPHIILVDGLEGTVKYRVPADEYQGKHPRPPTHAAYAKEIIYTVRKEIAKTPSSHLPGY